MNPSPIYNISRPYIGHHLNILSLSDLYLGLQKKIFKEKMHFHNITYMALLQQKNPCPWGHEIYNLGKFFFG